MRFIKKWKAHLNLDGFRMKNSICYDQKYDMFASWNSIRLLLTLSVVHKCNMVHKDYVMVFPQVPVEKKLYIKYHKVLS